MRKNTTEQAVVSRRVDSGAIRRILLRSTNWVGDAVLTTPAIRGVRKNFPDADIAILAKPGVAPIFYSNPHVDHVIVYDSAGRHAGWLGKVRLARQLRRHKFDLVILFQNAFEAALLAYLAGIPNRVGYGTDCRGIFLTHSIRVKPWHKQVHEIDYYLGILQGAGLSPDGRDLTLVVSEQDRQSAKAILTSHNISAGDRLLGLSPGSTYGSAKRWFPERFAAVGDRLYESHGLHIIIIGSPGEEAVGRRVSESMKHESVNLCGKTSLGEAMALIERCRLFITNDSGLMHVAAAIGIPLVAIFGSTNPVTTGPSSQRSCIVRVPVPCSPCLKPECPVDHRCMKEITVEMVYAAADAMLGERKEQ
ncbi:MAG: lipopolysaccharide heptosyltransferase II [Deltaproteobacteria bacterium]|nr:lipopolysaccharide heptosyltransferase II [Deltaproteobacteria bacterium]